MSRPSQNCAAPDRSTQAGGHVESVSRAARILKAFDPSHPAMSIRHISEKTGISRSTCHSMVATLTAEGLLEACQGGGYQLGPALASLGGVVLEQSGIVERALPHMEVLSSLTGGEVHLARCVDLQLIYLARVRRDRRVNMPNRFGRPIPLHETGCGWAALLSKDPAQLDTVFADVPVPLRRAAFEELGRARPRGYVVHSNVALGICSVATPISIGRQQVVALSVAQHRPLTDERRIAETGQLVLKVRRALEGLFA